MKDTHLTSELLDALVDLELPPVVLSQLMWKHTLALCQECREGFDQWVRKKSAGAYRVVVEGIIGETEDAAREDKAIERRIGVEFNELMRTPVEEREGKLVRANKRFSHPLLVERLLDESKDCLHSNPLEAAHLARLAVIVSKRCDGRAAGEYRVLTLAHLANAYRASGQLSRAAEYFRDVRPMVKDEGVMDSDVYAEIDRLEGSLRKDQGNFTEARKLLTRSALVYKLLGQNSDTARVLLKLVYVYFRLDDDVRALAAVHEALELVDSEEDLALAFYAHQNLASAYCLTGDPSAAQAILVESKDLIGRYLESHSGQKKNVHALTWLEGRIARGLESFEEAEEKLQEAAQGFGNLGIGYDTALVCLDLAETYLAQGEHEKVVDLAKQTEKLLSANDLTQEATAALLLFQQSTAQEVLSVEVIGRLRRRIEEKGLKRGVVVD